MRVAICDDNQQDIERIRRYTLRMIDYAVEWGSLAIFVQVL